ncbi:hypothetical protein E2P71_10265 [Candidatus Bathyarchaeota archaeon]|nr:hypothetical protein E2P71_10265 [Candidatus Bathyarchaeota archaeon]
MNKDRSFSIELRDKTNLRTITIENGRGTVIIEGKMGKTLEINHVEGVMLEICCSDGVLRVDLSEEEFESIIKRKKKQGTR